MLPYYMIESAHQNRFSKRKFYEIQFQRSQDLFNARKNRGLIGRMTALVRGRKTLRDLNDQLAGNEIVAQHALGRLTVKLEQITGTQGRADDFDRDFNPLNSRSRQRWTRIAIAQLAGDTLPPVELLKIGDAYFVSDGHHRVSVARAMGATYIDANVVEMVLQPRTVPAASPSRKQIPEMLSC